MNFALIQKLSPLAVHYARERAGLAPDRSDETFSRMIAKDGSIWPCDDTGYRYKFEVPSGL